MSSTSEKDVLKEEVKLLVKYLKGIKVKHESFDLESLINDINLSVNNLELLTVIKKYKLDVKYNLNLKKILSFMDKVT